MSSAASKQGYGAPFRWSDITPMTGREIRRAAGISDARQRRIMAEFAAAGVGFARDWLAANPAPRSAARGSKPRRRRAR